MILHELRPPYFKHTHRSSARSLDVPIYQLLGGKVRNKVKVYSWIGGDRPSEVETAA